jgi:hypothetical protein
MTNSETRLLSALSHGYSLAGEPLRPELRRGRHHRSLRPATVWGLGARLLVAISGYHLEGSAS